MAMDSFDCLLSELKQKSVNKSQQGTSFEVLMKRFFIISPLYHELFSDVWLWNEFPYNGGKHDFGIDLVAKMNGIDEYCAIQCKFYAEDYSIQKSDVDTFLSASGKAFFVNGEPKRYSDRIVVSTTDKWSKTAEDTIEGQNPAVTRIRLKDLKESGIDWDSFKLNNLDTMKRDQLRHVRPHQKKAIDKVIEGFKTASRGKLIMACGTGKTYTSLKIAEELTEGKGNILFLVPSISLLNQTLLEWSAQCKYDFSVFAICSDPKASKNADDGNRVSDTVIPATTNVESLCSYYEKGWEKTKFKLFFSTYQSIEVIHNFQKKTGLTFDLVICDEAHRTTGVTLANEDESNFVRVHDNSYLKANKRLYMTATPRIYGDDSKAKANDAGAELCSMDDEEKYGKEFFRLGFSEAVSLGLLSDYKVIVLAVDEKYVSRALQGLLTDSSKELVLDDAVKIIGCLNGLSKRTLYEGEKSYFINDPNPMKRAVAFSSSIKASKKFVEMFGQIQEELKIYGEDDSLVTVELEHVDGTNNALYRKEKIEWLKDNIADNHCRVLSNARCLSEGIDVPALDSVIFLNPRSSIVDIIQSVGRVMRKAEGKQYGYIILPIGIPAGIEPEQALSDNERYKIVWDVLQALRAHDDRFNNTINKIDLNHKKPDNISIFGVSGRYDDETDDDPSKGTRSYQNIEYHFEELQQWKESIYAKIVQKCGSRRYWENWAKDIADIANRHIEEIKILVKKPEIKPTFQEFVKALRSNLNQSINPSDAIEMLAEHMITKPVFDALFENYEFVKNNPVSQIMQDMLEILNEKAIDKEQEILENFYLSVQERAKGIDNAEGKQKIIIELYEQFFKNALPKQVEKLGIVYTPVEVVDFIINSVNSVLVNRFNKCINDKGIHVLDPFTGTGTFIVQLLRSGLLSKDNLLYKYTNEIHANEIVLLAYYIAAINIEETFHDLSQSEDYVPFEGIVLTDTFAMTEKQKAKKASGADVLSYMFAKNSARAEKQLKAPITVIIGNPPYSVGQKSGNDNNQNTSYEFLDQTIAETYVARSNSTLTRNAYDTYIKAFRWATDRIGDNGVIGFVTNGSFLDATALDGFRECLVEEFNYVYVYNLKGDQRTQGERSRREGGKIFGSGSRAPIAITILVKKKGVKKERRIHYYEVEDYLSREQKLEKLKSHGSMENVSWKTIVPNDNNDWINQRKQSYMNFTVIGDKSGSNISSYFSDNYASGLLTNRDPWLYNYSEDVAKNNAYRMIEFYNQEKERIWKEIDDEYVPKLGRLNKKAIEKIVTEIKNNDTHRISWSAGLVSSLAGKKEICSDSTRIVKVMYRPFCKKYLAYNRAIIERPSKWEKIYPENYENYVICISGTGSKKGFSALITDCSQDLQLLANAQCYPLYMYDKREVDNLTQISLFDDSERQLYDYTRRFAISDDILNAFTEKYRKNISKEDIFYYVYAVLHDKYYVSTYAENLIKEMPRIPFLKGFDEYVKIGKELAELHLNYETIVDASSLGLNVTIKNNNYKVRKMSFKKSGKDVDRSTIIFNESITINNIPERAYQYIVNGRSPMEWIMESYRIKTDQDSGIIDDPNTYGDDKYIYNLLISSISISIKTLDIIDSMPEYLEI